MDEAKRANAKMLSLRLAQYWQSGHKISRLVFVNDFVPWKTILAASEPRAYKRFMLKKTF